MDVYIFFSFSTRRASASTKSDVGLHPWYKIWRIVLESWSKHCMWNVDKLNYVSGYTEYHLHD